MICNICFLLAIVLRRIEISRQKAGDFSGVIGFQTLESTLVVLGYLAVLVNLFFLLMFFLRYPRHKMQGVKRWIIIFNFILLPMQLWYFLVSKI